MNYKKLSFITLALIGVFFFGCGDEEELPTSSNFETYTGELKSLGGIKINKEISHFFETDDGDVLYAYSTKYDLDDEEYFDKKIEAYGLVMNFESIDKEVFEIREISEAKIDDEETESAEILEYMDTGLGFKFSYPSNWEIEEFVDSVKLTASVILADANEEVLPNEEASLLEPDYIVISITDSVLTKTVENTLDERASEIRDFARSNYDSLVGVESELSYVGPDQVFAVKFKLQNGDLYYFTPMNSQLFEISFNHPSEEDRIVNTNTFSEIISSFRFIPSGENDADDQNSSSDEDEDSVNKEETEDSESVAALVAIPDGYREFESTPYLFRINYPEDWYYSGGNYGYDFNDEPIEDDTDALIRLDLISSGNEGTSTTGSQVSVTIKGEYRYYKVSGPTVYKSVIDEMAGSITEIKE